MIYDSLDYLGHYFPREAAREWLAFLARISASTQDGQYPLKHGDAFAKVMRYDTSAEVGKKLETHQKYIDVQCVVDGEEQVLWHPKQGLVISQPYDPLEDVELYPCPQAGPSSLILQPGRFAVFFPQDAHTGQLPVGEPGRTILKVVFKVPTSLFAGGTGPSAEGAGADR